LAEIIAVAPSPQSHQQKQFCCSFNALRLCELFCFSSKLTLCPRRSNGTPRLNPQGRYRAFLAFLGLAAEANLFLARRIGNRFGQGLAGVNFLHPPLSTRRVRVVIALVTHLSLGDSTIRSTWSKSKRQFLVYCSLTRTRPR
jgi:hypothetical protein